MPALRLAPNKMSRLEFSPAGLAGPTASSFSRIQQKKG